MNAQIAVAVGLVVWGLVFACLLAAQAFESDVERRWNQAWILDWERRRRSTVDDLIEQLAGQVRAWGKATRILSIYLWLAVAALAGLAALEYWREILSPTEFRSAMLFGVALIGLFFLPLRIVSEIGLGLVECMYRQVRRAMDERLVIEAREEIAEIPRPEKPNRKKKVGEAAPAQ